MIGRPQAARALLERAVTASEALGAVAFAAMSREALATIGAS